MTLIALYTRISTSKQEEENQLIQLREFAKKNNWEIFKEYTDIAISGKENSRPAFDELFRDAHKKLFSVCLFWDFSRFSRSGALFTLQKLQELENLGINWHSYSDPYMSSLGQFKDVVISLMATISKAEREKISIRTKAGLERLKAQGKVLGRPRGKRDKKKRVRKYFKKPVYLFI